MPPRKRRFAIALSFPGQHRAFVRNVANRLAGVLGKKRVFLDEWYQPELRGSGADLKLTRIYRDDAELVVPFFSKHYAKTWCQVEWHAIRAVLVARRQDDAVIPVHLDGTTVEGWDVIDFGIIRKAQSGAKIADELVDVYKQRRHSGRSADNDDREPPVPEGDVEQPVVVRRKKPGQARTSRQTVVLMDSTLPNVVYDPATRAQGGTNADDITDVLSDLPITVIKETTSLAWRRDEHVLRLTPDLIVVHFSAFYGKTTPDDSDQRLEDFLNSMSTAKTRFLIYSRMTPEQARWLAGWVKRLEQGRTALRGRLHVLRIEPGAGATFRNPDWGRKLKMQVKELLGLTVR